MTAIRRDGNETPFSEWIRSEPGLDSIRERLSVTDCDYWIHQYRCRRDRIGDRGIDSIMLVELKTHSAGLPFAQRDTLRIVNSAMHKCFYRNDGRIIPMRLDFGGEIRIVNVYGAFLLQLSGERPDESDEIRWHNRTVNLNQLVEILSFKRHPRTLNELDRRRHHSPPTRRSADLFRIGDAA